MSQVPGYKDQMEEGLMGRDDSDSDESKVERVPRFAVPMPCGSPRVKRLFSITIVEPTLAQPPNISCWFLPIVLTEYSALVALRPWGR